MRRPLAEKILYSVAVGMAGLGTINTAALADEISAVAVDSQDCFLEAGLSIDVDNYSPDESCTLPDTIIETRDELAENPFALVAVVGGLSLAHAIVASSRRSTRSADFYRFAPSVNSRNKRS